VSGLFDDTGAMATAAANEPTSVTRMINSIATSLMQSHKDGSILLPPHILDILANDNPETLEETLAHLIQKPFVTIKYKGRKLIIMADSTLNFSNKKHDASHDLKEIINNNGKEFYDWIHTEVVDGGTAKFVRRDPQFQNQRSWRGL
jgi:hypothetical protein